MSKSASEQQQNTSSGKLYVVPTPIGNLDDITLRAIKVLSLVDIVLVEDTRKTGKLLKHLKIKTKMKSHHQHNEHKSCPEVIQKLTAGEQMALVSDAGTPGISDPGFLIIRECIAAGILVEVLPGATAFVPALVGSGLTCNRFCFEGFVPKKKSLDKYFQGFAQEERTLIFYQSPHHIEKTLVSLIKAFGSDRKACVSRELTKLFEENKRGDLQSIANYFSNLKIEPQAKKKSKVKKKSKNNAAKEAKGEFVICVAGYSKETKNT